MTGRDVDGDGLRMKSITTPILLLSGVRNDYGTNYASQHLCQEKATNLMLKHLLKTISCVISL